jgi:hypothetical protein
LSDIIPLKTGGTIAASEVRSYFDGLFAAEKSGERFPVNLDDVWPFAFRDKRDAKAAVVEGRKGESFVLGTDYILGKIPHNSPGRATEAVFLTTDCMETIIARRSGPIFRVYQECRRIVWGMIEAATTRPDPTDAGDMPALLRAAADQIERLTMTQRATDRELATVKAQLAGVRNALGQSALPAPVPSLTPEPVDEARCVLCAKSILRWLMRGNHGRISGRDISLRHHRYTLPEQSAAIRSLIAHGYLRAVPRVAEKKMGRPPRESYEVDMAGVRRNLAEMN